MRQEGWDWTRRRFVKSIPAAALAAPLSVSAAAGERYRAASWWLTWEDLTWPNDELMDKIRRRADRAAAGGVNCFLIFGSHFRWDFMPLWGRLHDLLRFIAGELHQRGMVLFDHHSSVLVHRTSSRDEALNIWRRNRHHVPYYPSRETAATWQFNGSLLNDWRMIDVQTGQPVYLPAYNAEQFCMNHPAFREAYLLYVKKLLAETGIDGLMSDDGIFYAGWQACACRYCRERFQKKYGHSLPPVTDAGFWGNRRSHAFGDWIAMRYETCGDWVVGIQKVLPPGFPFLTCCSSSEGYAMPAYGMSYQDFIRGCNLVLLEMAGSTPSVAGTWDQRIPSQLLHLGIARDHRVGCFGLGYGFFPDTGFFVWALNKFLGADTWFSSLKGRLNASKAQLDALADDSELVEEGFRWEKAHPGLFTGEVDADTAVYFSRATRDYYGQCPGDYVDDYYAACLELLRAGISFDVVTAAPDAGKRRCLVLCGVACLSAGERRQLARYMEGGGTVIAAGPTGHYDERARPLARGWLAEHGIAAEIVEPERAGGFPPPRQFQQLAYCRAPGTGWRRAHGGRLLWRPERMTAKETAAAVIAELRGSARAAIAVKGLPPGWRMRVYRDGNRRLIHCIPWKVGTVLHASLANQFTRERVIEHLRYTALEGEVTVEPASRVVLHSPDLAGPRAGGNRVDLSGVKRYFVLECFV